VSKFSIEESVSRACDALNFHPSIKEGLAAELATLRAKAEAWDMVAFLYPLADGPVLCAEFDEQIERLKKLTPPARGEGTTFQSGDVDGTNPPPSEGQET